jgi:hypothetical protein
MAYYALLDENNIVNQVISGIDETEDAPEGYEDWEDFYGQFHSLTCKRTSYNTLANTHRDEGTPFRGNYAAVGYVYDETNDVFYEEQPFESWTLDTSTWLWEPPVAYPATGKWTWDEENTEWVEV